MTRQVTDNLYIELDYFTPEEYYVYVAEADAAVVSDSNLGCDANVIAGGEIVIASGDLPSFATLTVTLSHIFGADMFAFSEASLLLAADRIRTTNIDATSVFDTATDFVRTLAASGEFDAAFIQASTPTRSRDFDTQIEAAVSVDVTETRVRFNTSEQTVESQLFAVISNVRGVDIVQQNFASLDCSAEITASTEINLTTTSNINFVGGRIQISSAEFNSKFHLDAGIRIFLRNITFQKLSSEPSFADIRIQSGGRFGSQIFYDTGPYIGPDPTFNIIRNNVGNNFKLFSQGYTWNSSDGLTWSRENNNLSFNTQSATVRSMNFLKGGIGRPDRYWFYHYRQNDPTQAKIYFSDSTGTVWQQRSAPLFSINVPTPYIDIVDYDSSSLYTQFWQTSAGVSHQQVTQSDFNLAVGSSSVNYPNHTIIGSFAVGNIRYFVTRSPGSFSQILTRIYRLESNGFVNNPSPKITSSTIFGISATFANGIFAILLNDGRIHHGTTWNQTFTFTTASYANAQSIRYVGNQWVVTTSTGQQFIGTDFNNLTNYNTRDLSKADFGDGKYIYYDSINVSRSSATVQWSTDLSTWNTDVIEGVENANNGIVYTSATGSFADIKTIDLWVRRTSEGGSQIFGGLLGGVNQQFQIDAGSGLIVGSLRVLSAFNNNNNWNHIRVVIDGNKASLYWNGVRPEGELGFTENFQGIQNSPQFTLFNFLNSVHRAADVGIDEILFSKRQLNNVNDTSITVPTQRWTNDEDTLLLLHFDKDFADDSEFIVIPQANLTAVSQLSAQLTSTGPVTFASDLTSNSNISIQASVDRGADLEAFAEGTLTADVTRIQQGDADLDSDTALSTDAGVITQASADASALVNFASDVNITAVGAAAFESIASKLAAVAKVGDVIADFNTTSELNNVSVKTTDISELLFAEFTKTIQEQRLRDNVATAEVNSSLSVDAGIIFDQSMISAAEFTQQSDVNVNAVFDSSIDSEFTATIDASGGTIRAVIDLISETEVVLSFDITRGFDSNLVTESATDIAAKKIADVIESLDTATDLVVDYLRFRDNQIATDAVASKFVAAVKNITQDIEGTAEFSISIDGVKTTDIIQELTATSIVDATVVITAVADGVLTADTDLYAEGTTNITGEIHAASEFTLDIDADVTLTIELLAFSNANVAVEVNAIREFSSQLLADTNSEIIPQRLRFADSGQTAEFALDSTAEKLVDSGVLEFASIASKLTLGRLVNLDMKVYVIPAETRQYIIGEETRVFTIRRTR